MKAKVLVDQQVDYAEGRYSAVIKVYEVGPSKKYPDGIKARFALIDMENKMPLLVIDNHEPFGYHAHSKLPHNKHQRDRLEVKDYKEAMALFIKEVRRIINEE